MTLTSPLLSAVPGLRHQFFSRDGGVSKGIYAGLNAGVGSNDDAADVAENRRRMADQMGVKPTHFLTVHQIHSPEVVVATAPWETAVRPRADALVTQVEGLAIGATAADCGPVLLVDPAARVIGAAHAGWKGAFHGVLEATIAAMEKLGAERANIAAAIGPSIAREDYEVGPEFRAKFLEQDSAHARFFIQEGERFHFDLPGYVGRRLAVAGIADVAELGLSTYLPENRFFSFRRTTHRGEPDYGRQISAIALVK
jgi:hypothetical protein